MITLASARKEVERQELTQIFLNGCAVSKSEWDSSAGRKRGMSASKNLVRTSQQKYGSNSKERSSKTSGTHEKYAQHCVLRMKPNAIHISQPCRRQFWDSWNTWFENSRNKAIMHQSSPYINYLSITIPHFPFLVFLTKLEVKEYWIRQFLKYESKWKEFTKQEQKNNQDTNSMRSKA